MKRARVASRPRASSRFANLPARRTEQDLRMRQSPSSFSPRALSYIHGPERPAMPQEQESCAPFRLSASSAIRARCQPDDLQDRHDLQALGCLQTSLSASTNHIGAAATVDAEICAAREQRQQSRRQGRALPLQRGAGVSSTASTHLRRATRPRGAGARCRYGSELSVNAASGVSRMTPGATCSSACGRDGRNRLLITTPQAIFSCRA